jgi:acetylornithine deacetylase/succinyl-diaminopimelate desuccinylase-like protein
MSIAKLVLTGLCLFFAEVRAAAPDPLARDIFKQLIEINTTSSVGDTTVAAQAMARRLLAAGFPENDVQVLIGPNPKRGNLVARFHGRGDHRPVLIIGHLDVVEAKREDWSVDPFVLTEKDGYFYGRGTQDMKDADAIAVASLIRLHKEGFVPDRDVILALTADEETSGRDNGVKWLIENHRQLVDAEFVINMDAGGVDSIDGKPMAFNLEATEKQYSDFQLLVTSPGGHSSLPTQDNAIYRLAEALVRLEHAPFPFELNEVTRAWLQNMAGMEAGPRVDDIKAVLRNPPDPGAFDRLAQDRLYNATMRTTCVVTTLEAGHASNALPQRALANVNCRILPGHSPEEVQRDLIRILADDGISVNWVDYDGTLKKSAPSTKAITPPPLNAELMSALKRAVRERWPGLPILPEMEPGASDSIHTMAAGIPSYGFFGTAIDRDDVRAHGRDERLRVDAFDDGMEFFYRFLKILTGGN